MRAIAFGAILLANLLGGISYLTQSIALEGLPPATITTLRTFVAIACGLAWLACSKRTRTRLTVREHLRLATVGIFAYGGPLLLGTIGMEDSTSSNASVLILLEPITILFVSWLCLRERLRRTQMLGIAIALVGASLLVALDTDPTAFLERQQANITLALHGVLWGLYTPIMKPIANRHDPVQLVMAVMLYSLLLTAPVALSEASRWESTPALGQSLALIVVLGVFVSFLSTVLWNFSLRSIAASSVAPFVFLQPIVGTLAGHLVAGEEITRGTVVGGILIAAGVVFVMFHRKVST